MQRSVANDLGRASAYAEMTGSDPADVARKVKAVIADGLATAKAQPGVTVKSGGTHTYPIYSQGRSHHRELAHAFRNRCSKAAMRPRCRPPSASCRATSSPSAASTSSPAPETRRNAEDDATLEAIEAFQRQGRTLAATLKKPYRIRR